jgi:glucokinase
VVIGGGISAASDLLFPTIREEVAARVRTTSPGQVALATAELGTWAGAIGAAIHGAEQAPDAVAMAGASM